MQEYDNVIGWSDPGDGSVFADISAPVTGDGIRFQCLTGLATSPSAAALRREHC